MAVKNNMHNLKHGLSKKPIYKSWKSMKDRCKFHEFYVKQGIMYCNEWNKFEGFYKDMGSSYIEKLSLDRIDNNKGYYKENCRWVTMEIQKTNQRNIIHYTFNNKSLMLKDWSKELGIKRNTLNKRLITYKWSIDRAFTTPILKRDKHSGQDILDRLKNL